MSPLTQAKRDCARGIGANVALDRESPDLAQKVHTATEGRGVDLATDPIGGALFMRCLDSLARLSIVVSYNGMSGSPAGDVLAA